MTLYQRWIHRRERKLNLRDPYRRILPFDWGLEWVSNGHDSSPTDPLTYLKEYAETALSDSDTFFDPPPIADCTVKDDILTMATPTPSPHPENNTVHCRMFPARGSKSAVLVVPQWNADEQSHVRLCQIMKRLGITTLRLCMPYHERRLPSDMKRADYMVSPNIGRTIHAIRQAVLEVRQLVRWLKEEGYERIAVVGTSIGSCVTYLAFVHDPSICTGVFNHVSSFFADVVWTGLSTRYIRWGLNDHISLEDLRRCWAPISPWFFIDRLKTCSRPHLLITAKYDLTFRPELTEKVLHQYRSHNIPHRRVALSCGHYTIATFPFNYLDGWHMCQYLVGQLSARA